MPWDESRKMGWAELPLGGLIPVPGNTDKYATSGWRTFRPILDLSKCTDCAICWFFCPDSAIMFSQQQMRGFVLQHCKGCGLCAAVCPPRVSAIRMVEESEADRLFGKVAVATAEEKAAAKGKRPPEASGA
jgi:2-oxoacid:acceptor oxidoreductase delta subunit (pyruvate/2-ketoisovalerate family)